MTTLDEDWPSRGARCARRRALWRGLPEETFSPSSAGSTLRSLCKAGVLPLDGSDDALHAGVCRQPRRSKSGVVHPRADG
eukprot:CAMPEP_0198673124 /NCGR_PEP_ID=MMETSP1467-20131203/94805_1 /TAXON_ID=1462469 /ORGANISM="unid. sp., Strain CCMP2135" /LENGTH=79 /DNA_ID=CAMNT_0044409975 /DNA_START=98 /DNA_END=333 /DNA_ORIENTATION=-